MTPEIMKIDWRKIEDWIHKLAKQERFDAIVGVSRAGLPFAAALSSLWPESSLAILSRRGPRGEKPPRYDFEMDRKVRVDSLRRSLELSSLPKNTSRVLILDDVSTYGDTLYVAAEKVRAQLPAAQPGFACYAADEVRLRAFHPEILQRLNYEIAIDNSRIWVSFPWNLMPVAD